MSEYSARPDLRHFKILTTFSRSSFHLWLVGLDQFRILAKPLFQYFSPKNSNISKVSILIFLNCHINSSQFSFSLFLFLSLDQFRISAKPLFQYFSPPPTLSSQTSINIALFIFSILFFSQIQFESFGSGLLLWFMSGGKLYEEWGMALYPPSIRKMINFSWGSSRQQVPALLLVKRGLEVWYLGRGHGNTQYLSWYLHHDIFMSDIFMSNIRQSPTVHYRLRICQNEYLCSHFLGVNCFR